MEHLRNTKASVVELQGVRDLLEKKADLADVNAALSQVCTHSVALLQTYMLSALQNSVIEQ